MKKNGINKQGKKWFVFYAYIRPVLAVLLNIQTITIYLSIFNKLPFYGQVYCIGIKLLVIFNLIIWFLALAESKKLITLINYLLIYEIIILSMGPAMNEKYSNIESMLCYFLLVAIFALCWIWPNYIYFKKRKWIFQDDNDITICKNCNNKILKSETICPCCKNEIKSNEKKPDKDKEMAVCLNCKAIIDNDSKICPQCGETFEEDESIKEEKSDNKNIISSNSDIDKKYSDLNKLKKLLDKEIITKEEFEKEKKKILDK